MQQDYVDRVLALVDGFDDTFLLPYVTHVLVRHDDLTALRRDLLAWGEEHRRDLPWRRTRDPWAILVSELMLQQTQAPRVVPKFHAFMQRFPTPSALRWFSCR